MNLGELENVPEGLYNRIYQWVDLDGEGIAGILKELLKQLIVIYYGQKMG